MRYIITTLIMLSGFSVHAHRGSCSHAFDTGKHPVYKTTTATPEEDDYDVKYLKFNISLNNTNTSISGDVTTKALVKATSMATYAFELTDSLTIDSVKFNNQLVTFQTNGAIRKVNLSAPLAQNANFTAQVFYHGTSPAGGGTFFSRGLNHVKLTSGTELVYTLSDKDLAQDWWPGKQSIQDKIDSVDMWVTIPNGLKAGSNGLLKNITPMPGNTQRYEWHTQYPIDYYLISVAVAPYKERSYYMHFTDGSGDTMLIQNYVYDSATYVTTEAAAALDSTGYILDYMSTLFGKYPFYKEKYGHCIAEPLGGGMENQTMTTLAFAQTPLISHEMGHQWWGDHVTYASWRDIWLSEGYASYTEQLFVEHFRGTAAALAYRTSVFNAALAPTGSVYVDDTTNVNRIFSSQLTYKKGAAVAHMLRYIAPADTLYFKALRQYQKQYANSIATTADFQAIFEQVYGRDLDTFFNQWIYKEGFPTYDVKWYQTGTQIFVQVSQTTSKPASVPLFYMPLELKIKSAAGDTVIKFYNNAATQTFTMYFDKEMSGVDIDPNNNILNRNGFITKDVSVLNIPDMLLSNVEVYPNPAFNSWKISGLPDDAILQVHDLMGRLVWSSTASGSTAINAAGLSAGTYILDITDANKQKRYFKLMR